MHTLKTAIIHHKVVDHQGKRSTNLLEILFDTAHMHVMCIGSLPWPLSSGSMAIRSFLDFSPFSSAVGVGEL